LAGNRPPDRSGWRNKVAWILHGHIAFAVAALIGWEHLDLLWPTWALPEGIPVGGERRMAGFLTVGDPGRPVRLASSTGLINDWRHWIIHDERRDSSECLVIPEATRKRLVEGAKPRLGSAGAVQYWVEVKARRRLGPARCRQDGGLEIARGLDSVETLRPVPCSRDVFVAHGFVCPSERRSHMRYSEIFEDPANYYPAAAAERGIEGSVRVRVERDMTGSPVECTVLKSSGNEYLDGQTCKLVGTDPNFTRAPQDPRLPFTNVPITQTVTWRLPD
jgi:TonB family protein